MAEGERGVSELLQRRLNIQRSFMKDLRTAMNTAHPRVPAAGRRAFFNAAVTNASLRPKVTINNAGVINIPAEYRSGAQKLTFNQMDQIINQVNTHSGTRARGALVGEGALNASNMPIRTPRNTTAQRTALLARIGNNNGNGNGNGGPNNVPAARERLTRLFRR